MQVEFFDSVKSSTIQQLFNLVNFLIEERDGGEILFDLKIKYLDPTGLEIEEWVVQVEEVVMVDFGNLDYADFELYTPSIILKPKNCILSVQSGE